MTKTLNDFKYEEFTDKCVEELQGLQDELTENFNIDWYENWFYNDATNLFTLSTDKKEINFKYVNIGTFSRNTNTWKWSWDKEHTEESTKDILEKVRSYGKQNGFEKLTTGYFAADETEGWEFVAISAKLLEGLGAYRAVSDHLLIFMLLTEHVPNDEAEKIKDAFVDCSEHGYRRRAFVCHHLNKESKTGFVESFESHPGMKLELDDDFQAWCDQCEQERLKTKGWTDESMAFANIKLICEKCYFDIKEFNLGQS